MTVQAAVQMWSRHDAGLKQKSGKSFSATVREAYQVVSDPTDTIGDVLNAADLPKLGDQYKTAPQIRVSSIKPSQQSPIFWIVEVEYEGTFAGAYTQTGSVTGSPLDQEPIIRWGKTEREVPIREDRNGKALVNVLKEPLSGVTMTINDITANITRNYAGVDLAATHRYLHSVNSDTFLGFAAGTARLTSFDATEKHNEQDGGYYEVSAEITFRYPWQTTAEKTWYLRILNEGFLEMRSPIIGLGAEQPLRAIDEAGNDTAQKVLLRLDGSRVGDGEDPYFLEFDIYEPLSYNALGLL